MNKEILQRLKDSLNYEFDLSFNDRKELLSCMEQLEEEIAAYEFLIKTQNNREYRSKFLKEFQKEHGKNVFPDYDEIYKRYDKLKEENKQLQNNRDKAIEFLNTYAGYDNNFCLDYHEINPLIDILKGDSDEQE